LGSARSAIELHPHGNVEINVPGHPGEIKTNSGSGLSPNYFTYVRKKDLLEAGSGGFIFSESAGIA
jgi:hypothetical protein